MPTSIAEGKDWLLPRIAACSPDTVLDIGAGEGTYVNLLRPLLPDTRFTAIEIWAPYVAQFGLERLYDDVLVGDARELALPRVDVVILGDVLEHMSYPEARDLWRCARLAARQAVFASVPIVEAPQGAVHGNPHETHRHTWYHALGLALPGVTDSFRGQVIGCYRGAGTDESPLAALALFEELAP